MEEKDYTRCETLADKLALAFSADLVPMLWGAPGEGKTAIVQAFENSGYHVFVILGSTRQPQDFIGYPAIENGTMTFYPPDWAVAINKLQEQNEKVIVVLDELTTCPPAVQSAMLRIVNEREMCDGKIKFGSNVHIVAIANPKQQASGFDLTVAMKNRFVHLNVDTDEEWMKWLIVGSSNTNAPVYTKYNESHYKGYLSLIHDFFVSHTNNKYLLNEAAVVSRSSEKQAWASKRTWTFLARAMAACDTNNIDTNSMGATEFMLGVIGDRALPPFVQYILKEKSSRIFNKLTPVQALGIFTLEILGSKPNYVGKSAFEDTHNVTKFLCNNLANELIDTSDIFGLNPYGDISEAWCSLRNICANKDTATEELCKWVEKALVHTTDCLRDGDVKEFAAMQSMLYFIFSYAYDNNIHRLKHSVRGSFDNLKNLTDSMFSRLGVANSSYLTEMVKRTEPLATQKGDRAMATILFDFMFDKSYTEILANKEMPSAPPPLSHQWANAKHVKP